MEYRKFGDKYVIRLDKGEEVVETLKKFCEKEEIYLGTISGIGSSNQTSVAIFNTETKEAKSKDLTGDHEIILNGNISTMNDELYLHLHISSADSEFNVYGGHLKTAVVSATCEITIEAIEGKVDREFSEEIGLNLYKFD